MQTVMQTLVHYSPKFMLRYHLECWGECFRNPSMALMLVSGLSRHFCGIILLFLPEDKTKLLK